MKFKAIFALFNAVLVFSFLLIFFMPLLMLGPEAFSIFWERNWVIAVVFALTLGALNAFFIANWRLFRLLEKEDWPGLVSHLEGSILSRNRIRSLSVRMLLNAYLITSHTEGILTLEAFLKSRRPRFLGRFCIQFGIPYLLMKDPAASEAHFAEVPQGADARSRDWMRWNRAFALLQLARPQEAREEIALVLDGVGDPVLKMLCLYLREACDKQDGRKNPAAEPDRLELGRKVGRVDMEKRIERSSDNMELIVLSKIVEDASTWLYGAAPATEAPASAAGAEN